MSDAPAPAAGLWPVLAYEDASAAIPFLTDVLGFALVARYEQGGAIVHAELSWPEGGTLTIHDAAAAGPEFADRPTGGASCYLVTRDPQPVLDRCRAAAAPIVRPMAEEDHGSLGFTTADPEGNLWSLGTYAGQVRGDLRAAAAG